MTEDGGPQRLTPQTVAQDAGVGHKSPHKSHVHKRDRPSGEESAIESEIKVWCR